jgi:glycosyltransferase involved in cell wall biosynthesis
LILGTGADEDALRSQVISLKLENRVFFKGFVSHDTLPEYLQACDIFIRPSRSEGLGNSFLEAMAAGIPVIATPVGGIPDFLVDGETGLLCEVDNPQSIAQKIEKFTKDMESRRYIVANAQKMVQQKYDWNSVAEKMKGIFDRL